MRNSDYIFFGTLLISMLFVFTSVIFTFELTKYFTLGMIIFLLPFAFTKEFLPNTRFGKWLNYEHKLKK